MKSLIPIVLSAYLFAACNSLGSGCNSNNQEATIDSNLLKKWQQVDCGSEDDLPKYCNEKAFQDCIFNRHRVTQEAFRASVSRAYGGNFPSQPLFTKSRSDIENYAKANCTNSRIVLSGNDLVVKGDSYKREANNYTTLSVALFKAMDTRSGYTTVEFYSSKADVDGAGEVSTLSYVFKNGATELCWGNITEVYPGLPKPLPPCHLQ